MSFLETEEAQAILAEVDASVDQLILAYGSMLILFRTIGKLDAEQAKQMADDVIGIMLEDGFVEACEGADKAIKEAEELLS